MSTFLRKFKQHETVESSQPAKILVLEFWNFETFSVQVQFDRSKTKLNIQYNQFGIRVVLQVAEQVKTQDLRKLGNIRNISNLSGNQCPVQCPTSLPEMKVWQQQSKNTQKYISKFCLVKFYRMSLFCFKYFDRDCRLIESYKKNKEQKIQKKYQNTIRQQ